MVVRVKVECYVYYKDSKTGYYYEINVIPEIYWTYSTFQYFKNRITFVKNVHPSFGFND